MTSEHRRLLFSLKDILAVRWQCNECHTAISLQLDQPFNLPETCPSCNASLLDLVCQAHHRQLRDFFEALKSAKITLQERPPGATLQLEFDQP